VNHDDDDFENLLQYLCDDRGFDFTGYKRPSLRRRIGKRMGELGIETSAEYLDFLQVHPDEFARLFDTILINVTAFYRDAAAWEHLATHALPLILEGKRERQTIRVWTAGCASGEEAYTTAIVLAEALGPDVFMKRVKVYATDADDDALETARHGAYSAKDLSPVPSELVSKYFEEAGSRFVFRKDLRRSVIFGRHDLVQDAPISRLDLLICRNTLMYFNAQLQRRILRNFHFALNDPGLLMLGKAETLLTHKELFTPVDLRHRVFTKVGRTAGRDRSVGPAGREPSIGGVARHVLLRDAAIDTAPVAQVLVDADGELLAANARARSMFNLSTTDLGRDFHDLELSYRPVELRSRIDAAYRERRPAVVANVDRVYGDGEVQTLDVTIAPVFDNDEGALGVVISFADITRYRKLRSDLERSNQELETAYEELQSTNEELETTNEELQSTVEELETTNEELETTNEELQSTNAEVQATNEMMKDRSIDLNQLLAFSRSVLATLPVGVIVVDRNRHVRLWNERSEEMWGVRGDEVEGVELSSLDVGLPTADLEAPITRGLDGRPQSVRVEATNRRGRKITCEVRCGPLAGPDGTIQGVVVLVEER